MAIVRIKANKRWFRQVLIVMHDQPKLIREVERAMERPGLTASLTAPEMRDLAARMPDDPNVVRALSDLEAAEENDRIRKAELNERMDRFRSEARWDRD